MLLLRRYPTHMAVVTTVVFACLPIPSLMPQRSTTAISIAGSVLPKVEHDDDGGDDDGSAKGGGDDGDMRATTKLMIITRKDDDDNDDGGA